MANPITPVDAGRSIGAGLQIRGQMQALQDAKQQRQDRQTLKDLYAQQYGPNAQPVGQQEFVAQVGAVDPGQAMDWRKHFASQDKARTDQLKAEAPLVAGALRGVKDDQGYQRARQFLLSKGIDDLPDVYDPAQVNMVAQGYNYLAGNMPKAPSPQSKEGKRQYDVKQGFIDPSQEKPGGPFEGTGMDAQSYNILLTGDPNSAKYAAAYNREAQPRQSYDAQSGQVYTINPDMSAFRLPTGRAPAQGGSGGMTIQQVGSPKLNKEEKDAAGFATRLQNSDNILGQLGDVGTGAGAGLVRDFAPNFLKPADLQRLERAQKDFINAILRRESGAAIGQKEFDENAAIYFPQPGDSAEVLADKAGARRMAIRFMRNAAGRAEVLEPEVKRQAPQNTGGLQPITEQQTQTQPAQPPAATQGGMTAAPPPAQPTAQPAQESGMEAVDAQGNVTHRLVNNQWVPVQ